MPNPKGVNRRRRPKPKKQEQKFLRKAFLGDGPSVPAKVLKILGWALLVWVISVVFFGDTGLVSILRMRSMKQSLEGDIRILEEAKAEAAEWKEALEGDPETIERVAREEYGMICDGERVYRFVDEGE